MFVKHFILILFTTGLVFAQDGPPGAGPSWSLHLQATSIGQEHGPFPSAYEGPNSLPPHAEHRVSLTTTLFLALRLNRNWEFVVNPEVAGGRGFGQVTGIAGFTNGEIPRVASATPTPYIARAFVRYTVPLGSEMEVIENAANQAASALPARRLTTIAGRFAATDFFDTNAYSHDPRGQFMNWALMSNGAWDYPADVRGYTVGLVEELKMKTWAVRATSVMEPTIANGADLDTRVGRNRGLVVEFEKSFSIGKQRGTLRTLAFDNLEHAGTYREAITAGKAVDITTIRKQGARKYGFGVNLEQPLAEDAGVFARYGWNDGKTESWAFTEIDRSATAGISIRGRRWHRSKDTVGLGYASNFLSGDHRSYLAAGGMGFIIGDGRLTYGSERTMETYYAFHLNRAWTVTGDFQYVTNPAYNRDRGPVPVGSLRIHWEH